MPVINYRIRHNSSTERSHLLEDLRFAKKKIETI